MMLETLEFSVGAVIAEVVIESNETDPMVIAREVAERVPEDALREALAIALRSDVVRAFQVERVRAVAPQTSSKWKGAANAVNSGAYDIFAFRVYVADAHKLLGDCSADDLAWLIDDRRRRAREQTSWARAFSRLRKDLQAAGADSVRELDRALVEQTLQATA